MRAGGAPFHADKADDVAAANPIADLHPQRVLMDIGGGYAMTVIEQRGAAGQEEVRLRQ
jgi:hypothetical protein